MCYHARSKADVGSESTTPTNDHTTRGTTLGLYGRTSVCRWEVPLTLGGDMRKLLLALVVLLALILPAAPAHAQAEQLTPATLSPDVAFYLASLHARQTVSDVWRYLGAQEWEIQVMQCIGNRESHWDAWRDWPSPTDDYGVMQINGWWWRAGFANAGFPELLQENRYGLGAQALGSWIIYQRGGWRQWSVHSYCGV